jgi:hypothetical protein
VSRSSPHLTMKLLAVLGLIGMVAAQHAGEMGIDDKGNRDGAKALPTGPGADDITQDAEEAAQFTNGDKHGDAQNDWKESHAHGSQSSDRSGEARTNQWNVHQATAKKAKSTATHVNVKINGIMTMKVPHCMAPFIVGDHTSDSNIEDMECKYPTVDSGCEYPLQFPEAPFTNTDPCVPLGPWCPHPLIYDSDAKECIPLIPRIGKGNAILDNSYIGAVLRQDGADHNNKAPRVHQAVENDPNDNVMIKERHTEENNLWNWEKVRRHTGN